MKKRKVITSQFKREAVRLTESSEKPAFDVTPQLGVRRNQLYKWKEQLDTRCAEAFPGAGRQQGQVDEMSRLRQGQGQRRARHFKKGSSVLCQGARVKYRFIRAIKISSAWRGCVRYSGSVAMGTTTGENDQSPSVPGRIAPC